MPFRFDKFTIKAQEAVQGAVELAASRGNPQTTPVHLLDVGFAKTASVISKWGAGSRDLVAAMKPTRA